jgi:P4 family phage/plasmid primase-like protien
MESNVQSNNKNGDFFKLNSKMLVKFNLRTPDANADLVSIDKLIREITQRRYDNSPIYESFGGGDQGMEQMVRPYFDVDVDFEEDNKPDFESILKEAKKFIMDEFECLEDDLMLSFAHRSDKMSCHIIIPTLKTKLSEMVRWKKQKGKQLEDHYIDPMVYRKGNFRLVGTSKEEYHAPLIIQNGNLEDHFVTILNGQERDWKTSGSTTNPNESGLKQAIKCEMNAHGNKGMISVLVGLLSSDRSELYEDWINVGMCLKNLGEEYLPLWIEFSQQSSKYKEGECQCKWLSFNRNGKGIGSLRMWAQMDNPNLYRQLIDPPEQPRLARNYLEDVVMDDPNEQLDKLITENLPITSYGCSLVLKYLIGDTMKYIGNGNWYYFDHQKWTTIKENVVICRLIVNQVIPHYQRHIEILKAIVSNQKHGSKDEICDHQILKKDCETCNYHKSHLKFAKDALKSLMDSTFKNKVSLEMEHICYDPEFEDLLNANNYLLGFNNGVYDLSNGIFRKTQPNDYISLSTGYDYIPLSEDDPSMLRTYDLLKKIFPQKIVEGEKISQFDASMRIYASLLEGENKEQHFYIQSNKGSNGKSLLSTILCSALGSYSTTVSPLFFTEDTSRKSASNASPETASLKWKRFIYAEEPKKKAEFDFGKIKEITGNTKISTRQLYKETFTFKPQFKPIFSCNELPDLHGVKRTDYAVWRRIKCIPFDSRFELDRTIDDPQRNLYRADKTLFEQVDSFRLPLMNILLRYYRDYKSNGLIILGRMNELEEHYKIDCDPFHKYFIDYLEVTDDPQNIGLSLKQIWNSYKKDATYYVKGTLMKDIKQYFEDHQIPMTENKRACNGTRMKNCYPSIKWIDESNVKHCIDISLAEDN